MLKTHGATMRLCTNQGITLKTITPKAASKTTPESSQQDNACATPRPTMSREAPEDRVLMLTKRR